MRGEFLRGRWIPLAIAAVTLIVYAPALRNGFVDFDDKMNFLDNPHFRGLGWKQLRWMLTTFLMGHWIPLTWMTLGLDYSVWGMNPFGYHLTNVLLHAANAAVFYFVARRLLGKAMARLEGVPLQLGAGLAALFFALHPLRAESVAWVTERRDVVSGLFFLLTILTYLRACEADGAERGRWLAGSVGCYALALASKSIVMTLPFILILLDAYPLGRLSGRWRDWLAPHARPVWKEKVPYLLLAVAGAAMALYAVRMGTTLNPPEKLPLAFRGAGALWKLWLYARKTLFPLDLSPLYELPGALNPLAPQLVGSAIAVGILTGGFWLLRRRWPAGLAAWVGYVVMLMPVSGLAHAAGQPPADRYTYLACLGWALLMGAAVCALVRGLTGHSLPSLLAFLMLTAAAVWIVGLAAITWNQVQIWRDADTLWRYALEVDPDCARCRNNLGTTLGNRGLLPQAIEQFERALAIRPHFPDAHRNLGLALLLAGEPAKAGAHLERALSEAPEDQDARAYLGEALLQQGKPAEAILHLERVIRQNHTHVRAMTSLGFALAQLGRPAETILYFQRAIALQPDAPLPRLGLARAFLALGNTAAAREQSEILRRLDPRLALELPFP